MARANLYRSWPLQNCIRLSTVPNYSGRRSTAHPAAPRPVEASKDLTSPAKPHQVVAFCALPRVGGNHHREHVWLQAQATATEPGPLIARPLQAATGLLSDKRLQVCRCRKGHSPGQPEGRAGARKPLEPDVSVMPRVETLRRSPVLRKRERFVAVRSPELHNRTAPCSLHGNIDVDRDKQDGAWLHPFNFQAATSKATVWLEGTDHTIRCPGSHHLALMVLARNGCFFAVAAAFWLLCSAYQAPASEQVSERLLPHSNSQKTAPPPQKLQHTSTPPEQQQHKETHSKTTSTPPPLQEKHKKHPLWDQQNTICSMHAHTHTSAATARNNKHLSQQ